MIFPGCGITLDDVRAAALESPNKRAAAKRLGICERQFYSVIKASNLGHLFARKSIRRSRVDLDEVKELAAQGFIRRDVAFLVGISSHYLRDLIEKHQLQTYFTVHHGRAATVNRKGYCE